MPTPGYKFVEVDLSQIELRLVAWMANEPTMLEIYRTGGDIHTATAIAVAGITMEAYLALSEDEQEDFRRKAKAALTAGIQLSLVVQYKGRYPRSSKHDR